MIQTLGRILGKCSIIPGAANNSGHNCIYLFILSVTGSCVCCVPLQKMLKKTTGLEYLSLFHMLFVKRVVAVCVAVADI